MLNTAGSVGEEHVWVDGKVADPVADDKLG